MTKCDAPSCDQAADEQIKLATGTETLSYCLAHSQQRRHTLDSALVHYTTTSITKTEPSQGDLLSDSYGKLQKQHEELVALRSAIPMWEKKWNECDQARQAAVVSLDRTTQTVNELAQENALLRGQLAAMQERLERAEVETLTGVDGDPDSDGPQSVVQGS